MKRIFILFVIIYAALLFFSCDSFTKSDGHGILVVSLPESASRAAGDLVTGVNLSSLRFRIDCSGESYISQTVRYGSSAKISLPEGFWTVTLTVLNSIGENIGESEKQTVNIIAGSVSSAAMVVAIDTSRIGVSGGGGSVWGGSQ
jgi:hypothetical protein